MITKLQVRNFRASEAVEIEFDRLTAIVGPNGSGKTSVIRALDIVAGDAWPSLRSFRIPQDFTDFDTKRSLAITVHFDPPYEHEDALKKVHKVSSLRVKCQEYKKSGKWGQSGDLHVDVEPLKENGEVPLVAVTEPQRGAKPKHRPLSASTGMRDVARIILIDHRRSLVQHLPSARGSPLARLLEPARKEFERSGRDSFREQYEAAMGALRTKSVREVEQTIADTAKRMLGFLGPTAVEAVNIGFGFSDPANPFSSLRIQYAEGELQVPGEELGLGVQSAIVVGVFEALRRLSGPVGTVVIEEPEMYLHPQAQRYFYRLLCEMADDAEKGCQVIYTTHSPIFADINRFESLRVFRREPGKRTSVHWVSDQEDREFLSAQRERYKLSRFDSVRSEVLFAKRALLVEGPGDVIAAAAVAQKLGHDLDAEGLAIVECGGKGGLPLVIRLCKALAIPCVVMHDTDIWPLDDQNGEEEEKNKRIEKAAANPAHIFLLDPSLEHALDISRNASDKPLKIAEEIEKRSLEELPEPLVQAVKALVGA
ncbi:MAG: ATP-dependent endonuclease [Fimbriimonadales bacterium]|nr:MAG: ATP-dependent endonuclease [Fimbriimonadales bacterium]